MSETQEHLDDTTWEKLAVHELDPAARASALRHIMACPRCRVIHRGLRALEDDARAEDLLPARAPRRRPWLIGLAAAIAIAAAVVVWWSSGSRTEDPTLRGSAGAALEVSSPTQLHPGDKLRWTSTPRAATYHIELYGEDGRRVWDDTTTATEIVLPTAAMISGRYRWRVAALGADGAQLAISKLIAVEVVP